MPEPCLARFLWPLQRGFVYANQTPLVVENTQVRVMIKMIKKRVMLMIIVIVVLMIVNDGSDGWQ